MSDLKVHAYLLCFNEEPIIKSVLNYYSRFCSKIFVLDNESTDKSVDIAESFENVRVISWKKPSDIFDDKYHVKLKIDTYKLYSRDGGVYTEEVADWVVVSDMDEVLYHPDLLNVLSEYKSEGVTVPQICGFNVVDEKSIDVSMSIVEQYKYGVRHSHFDKRIVFQPDFNMSYSLGCHPAGPGFELMKNTYGYRSSNKYPLALLHYKHVGSRFYDKAKEYSELVDKGQVWRGEDGLYKGVASHYFNFVDSGESVSPFLKDRKKLFDEEGNILFDNFPKVTGEKGIGNKLDSFFSKDQFKVFRGDSEAADILRELAIAFKSNSLDSEALHVVRKALELRPNGPHLNKIFRELSSRKDER